MIHPIRLPQLTETMEEATILRWLKAIGDRVERQDKLYEVETDKMTIEVESVDSGYLCAVAVPEGVSARVGQEVGRIADSREECP